jgi:hypothetical protein
MTSPRRSGSEGLRVSRPPTRAPESGRELGLGDNPLEDVGAHEVVAPEPVPASAEANALYDSTPPVLSTPTAGAPKKPRARGRQPLPDGRTFRLVTFSFYEEDVARLDALMKAARHKGHRRANRSQIVRLALRQFNLDALPDDL